MAGEGVFDHPGLIAALAQSLGRIAHDQMRNDDANGRHGTFNGHAGPLVWLRQDSALT